MPFKRVIVTNTAAGHGNFKDFYSEANLDDQSGTEPEPKKTKTRNRITKDKQKTFKVDTYLDLETYTRLKEYCKTEDTTTAAVLRKLIKRHLC